jgi:hypothetical protein
VYLELSVQLEPLRRVLVVWSPCKVGPAAAPIGPETASLPTSHVCGVDWQLTLPCFHLRLLQVAPAWRQQADKLKDFGYYDALYVS